MSAGLALERARDACMRGLRLAGAGDFAGAYAAVDAAIELLGEATDALEAAERGLGAGASEAAR